MVAILKRAALTPAAFALIAVALGGCMGTTYGTGVNPGAQTISDIGGLVNLGGQKKPAVDYTPRPPLAAPPPGVAPPPPGSARVASSGDWPNDPDVAARARKAAAANNPTGAGYDPGIKIPVQHPEGPQWYNKNRFQGPEPVTKEQEAATRKLMASSKTAVTVDANGNPVRKTLAEPPVAYREPDPNAPTVFKTAKKFHWPWQKAQPDAVPTDDSASSDKTANNGKTVQ